MMKCLRIGKSITILSMLMVLGVNATDVDLDTSSTTEFTLICPDIPLMEGLYEVQDGIDFDTEQGRIASMEAFGNVPKSNILSYYQDSLSELGWEQRPTYKEDAIRFTREGQELSINVSEGKNSMSGDKQFYKTLVVFKLVPNKT